MYVLFIAASPRLIEVGSRRGWGPLLAVSAALWLFAQLGGGQHIYESIARLVEWPVPYAQTGAFSLLAWQLLWLVGLRAGTLKAEARLAAGSERPWPRALVFGALSLAAVFFVMRHVTGQVPFATDAPLNALFDKWHLGPLRLANFAVLAILAVHWRDGAGRVGCAIDDRHARARFADGVHRSSGAVPRDPGHGRRGARRPCEPRRRGAGRRNARGRSTPLPA
jgi:hypothetical protein